MVWNEPRSAGALAREGLVGLWSARGGGLYGLGYVVSFVILELRTVVGEFEGSHSLMSFIGQELLAYLLRVGFMSFVNAGLAFVWPAFVLQLFGGWGILLLLAGYFAFERGLRPTAEARFPELRRRPRRRRKGPQPDAVEEDAGSRVDLGDGGRG